MKVTHFILGNVFERLFIDFNFFLLPKLKVTDSKLGLISKKLCLQAPCQIWKPPVRREWCLILLTSWTFTGISVVFYSIRNVAESQNMTLEKPFGYDWSCHKVIPIHILEYFQCFIFSLQRFSLCILYTWTSLLLQSPRPWIILYIAFLSPLFHDLFP